MRLILSCITKGEDQLRGVLERLAQAGIAKHAIVVLHPGAGPRPTTRTLGHDVPGDANPVATSGTLGSAVVEAVASGGTIGGTFGWVVGYGVLALPGALLGGAVGAAAGAVIGASRRMLAPHLTDDVQHHYASRIVDDHAAVLVQVQELQQYERVLMAFLAEGGKHILTSRNNPALAESAQLEELMHPEKVAEVATDAAAAGPA